MGLRRRPFIFSKDSWCRDGKNERGRKRQYARRDSHVSVQRFAVQLQARRRVGVSTLHQKSLRRDCQLQRLVRQSRGQYAWTMTRALEQVISQISSLPPDEQDRIAGWVQSELVAEEGWAHRFAKSQDVLKTLADEAVADEAAGRTTDLDPDKM